MNALRGGHTHIFTLWTKAISRNQLHAGQRLAKPFLLQPTLKILHVTPIFNIKVLCLVTNVQLLKHLLHGNKQPIQSYLGLLKQVSNNVLHDLIQTHHYCQLISVELLCIAECLSMRQVIVRRR